VKKERKGKEGGRELGQEAPRKAKSQGEEQK
jgi:hypothetical protein